MNPKFAFILLVNCALQSNAIFIDGSITYEKDGYKYGEFGYTVEYGRPGYYREISSGYPTKQQQYYERPKSYEHDSGYYKMPTYYEKPIILDYTKSYPSPKTCQHQNHHHHSPKPYYSQSTYQKPVTSHETYTPSPYQKPLSYIKLIAYKNEHYSTTSAPIYTPIISKNTVVTKPMPSKIQHQPVPKVVISSTNIPLNLNLKSTSSKVKVSQEHENQPPEEYHSYLRDGEVSLTQEVHRPIVQTVKETIAPERHIVQKILPVKEDIRTVVYKNEEQTRPEYDHSYRQEQPPSYHDHRPVQYDTTPTTYYRYVTTEPSVKQYPNEGNYQYFYQ